MKKGTIITSSLPAFVRTVMIALILLAGSVIQAQTYYSEGSVEVNLPDNWNSAADGSGTSPASFDGIYTWIIQEGHSMVMSGDWIVGASGPAAVIIEGDMVVSSTYLVNVTGTLTINGTLTNSGTYISASPVTASSGTTINGTYNHNQNDGYLPAATWANGSICLITGWTSTASPGNTSFDQDFYNFTWNCAGQSVNVSFLGHVPTVNGTFRLDNTGAYNINPRGNVTYGNYYQTGGTYSLTHGASVARTMTVTNDFTMTEGDFFQSTSAAGTLNVGGNYTMSGGEHWQSTTYGLPVTTVGGNFTMTGGYYLIANGVNSLLTVEGNFGVSGSSSFTMSRAAGAGTLEAGGNFTHTGGTIRETSTGSGTIVFNGTGTQTYTSGGTLSGTINFTVGSGSDLPVLQMGTGASPAVISSGSDGSFTLLAGATLGVTSPDGITTSGATGNIQVTGSRNFSIDADYIYNGLSTQSTGNGLPSTVRNLTFNISGGGTVTFDATHAIQNNFSIATGSVANPGSVTTYTAGAVTLGGVSQAGCTIGSSASGADVQSDDYFTPGTTGYITTCANGTWLGGTSADWNDATNWHNSFIPVSTTDVVITSAAPNQPVISASASAECNDLYINTGASFTINSGQALTVNGELSNYGILTIGSGFTDPDLTPSGSLIVIGAGYGNVTFNRQFKTYDIDPYDSFDWHYFSSPVMSPVAPANNSANNGKITAVYDWDETFETEGTWNIITSGLVIGRGYNLDQTTSSDGMISFTGTIVKSASVTATSPYSTTANIGDDKATYDARWTNFPSRSNYGGGGWNLLGNPFTSALKISDDDAISTNDFLSVNSSSFDPNYLVAYIYDGSVDPNGSYSYIGISIGGGEETNIQVGQGFFVLAGMDNVNFSFASDMQGHDISVPMLKSASKRKTWPYMKITMKYGKEENQTSVVFNEDMTVGLDPGYDVGLLSTGSGTRIYTALIQDNGINFARQALPISGCDSKSVAMGVDLKNGGIVTFSAVTAPVNRYNFYLEDRVTGIFTDLANSSYTVDLPVNTLGTGRFYIHTKLARGKYPRQEYPDLKSIRIWSADNDINIQGIVSDKAICYIYDLKGNKILEKPLIGGGYNTFALPFDAHGVYLVIVKDGLKRYSQKVIFI